MGLVGARQHSYARALFILFAVLSALLFVYQIVVLQRLKLIPVYMLPFLSFFICFENVVLYYSDEVSPNRSLADTTFVFQSFIIPFFITILFEMVYRLHQLRMAHFFFVPFDEGPEKANIPGFLVLGFMRILVVGMFTMNMLSNFEVIATNAEATGRGGYVYLSKYNSDGGLILDLVPTMILSLIAISLGVAMYRYGNRLTFETSNNQFWKLLLVSGIGYSITHIFGPTYYSWTSNLGDITLLISSTILVQLVQDDLELAKNYVDFLRRSNIAFSTLDSLEKYKGNVDIVAESVDVSTKRDPLQPRVSMGSLFPGALIAMIPEASDSIEFKDYKNSRASDIESSLSDIDRVNTEHHSPRTDNGVLQDVEADRGVL